MGEEMFASRSVETGRQVTDMLSSGICEKAELVPGFLAEGLSGFWLNSDPLPPASLPLILSPVNSQAKVRP